MEYLEDQLPSQKIKLFAIDEVGRGPIAGPVVSCCVSFEGNSQSLISALSELKKLNLTDSKKLTQKKRLKIIDFLGIELSLLFTRKTYSFSLKGRDFTFSLWDHDHRVIDEMNILAASLDSMAQAAIQLKVSKNDIIWIDGNKKPKDFVSFPLCESYVKGDSRSGMIALASIIAKEWRDQFMSDQAQLYPHYGFEKHAGYPTKAHKEAVIKYGPCPIHRLSFKGVKEYAKSGNIF